MVHFRSEHSLQLLQLQLQRRHRPASRLELLLLPLLLLPSDWHLHQQLLEPLRLLLQHLHLHFRLAHQQLHLVLLPLLLQAISQQLLRQHHRFLSDLPLRLQHLLRLPVLSILEILVLHSQQLLPPRQQAIPAQHQQRRHQRLVLVVKLPLQLVLVHSLQPLQLPNQPQRACSALLHNQLLLLLCLLPPLLPLHPLETPQLPQAEHLQQPVQQQAHLERASLGHHPL